MANTNDFLGRGWSFPPTFDRSRREVAMLEAEDDIRGSLEILLSTEAGERILQPTFGWKRDRWLFESMTTTAAMAIRKEIETTLLFFEPRIDLLSVRLVSDQLQSGRVEIHVDYRVRSTNTRNNLVFPFYLSEV